MARVLIIEDEPAIAWVLEALMADEGHQPIVCHDGSAGLAYLLGNEPPDVVLADLFMPGISGRELVMAMRSDPRRRHLPVILITGAVPNAADFPPEGSYQRLLPKPFQLDDVIAAVADATAVTPYPGG